MDTKPKVLDGKLLANDIISVIAEKTEKLSRKPQLVVIQVGDDPASTSYIRQKEIFSKRAGFKFNHVILDSSISQNELLGKISVFNNCEEVDGILVQLPLPQHICAAKIANSINPSKDVDGFSPHNMGGIFNRQDTLAPCTPKGIIRLIEHTGIKPEGLHAVVVGASNIVGQPLATMLSKIGMTVTICQKTTKNLSNFVSMADVLVSATGNTKAIDAGFVKKGAVVIDVGINFDRSGKITGDLEQEKIKQLASWYTPVPGGVGPMTVAMLIENTWNAYIDRTS